MDKSYSKNWNKVLVLAKKYQRALYEYISANDDLIKDLKESLKDREDTYYALEIIKNFGEEIKINILEELCDVSIFGNVSDAATAKAIILSIESKNIQEQLMSFFQKTALKNKHDNEVIKDIALFLYDLKYNSELQTYIAQYKKYLKESDFF